MDHGVAKEEGSVLVREEETLDSIVHQIGHVFLVTELQFHAVHTTGLSLAGCLVPLSAAAIEVQVVIDAGGGGIAGDVAPFADV